MKNLGTFQITHLNGKMCFNSHFETVPLHMHDFLHHWVALAKNMHCWNDFLKIIYTLSWMLQIGSWSNTLCPLQVASPAFISFAHHFQQNEQSNTRHWNHLIDIHPWLLNHHFPVSALWSELCWSPVLLTCYPSMAILKASTVFCNTLKDSRSDQPWPKWWQSIKF